MCQSPEQRTLPSGSLQNSRRRKVNKQGGQLAQLVKRNVSNTKVAGLIPGTVSCAQLKKNNKKLPKREHSEKKSKQTCDRNQRKDTGL